MYKAAQQELWPSGVGAAKWQQLSSVKRGGGELIL